MFLGATDGPAAYVTLLAKQEEHTHCSAGKIFFARSAVTTAIDRETESNSVDLDINPRKASSNPAYERPFLA